MALMKNFAITLISLLLLNFSLLAQDYPTHKAKSGETIYAILRKHHLPPGKYLSVFKELNQGKLTKNDGLIIGVTYRVPIDGNQNAETTPADSTQASPKPDTPEESKLDTDTPPIEHRTFVAKSGDGITIVLQRHGLSPDKYFKEFVELNQKNIGKNNDLFIGKTYKLPLGDAPQANQTTQATNASSSSSKKESLQKAIKKLHNPMYGDTYQHFNQVGNSLQGAIYYLISGHGGPDPGAHGTYAKKSIYEDEYAYDVTLRLARELEAHGAKVYMIIYDKNDGIRDDVYLPADKDEYCYPRQSIPLNQVRRLKQRSEAVNKLYKKNKGSYQRCIITHIDSRNKRTPIDAFFYYDERSSGGKKLAETLYKTLDSKYRNRTNPRDYHGTVSTRSLYVLRSTLPIATFIELGNINYYRDIQRIVLKDNRQALANWLCEGLIEDYKKNKDNK